MKVSILSMSVDISPNNKSPFITIVILINYFDRFRIFCIKEKTFCLGVIPMTKHIGQRVFPVANLGPINQK